MSGRAKAGLFLGLLLGGLALAAVFANGANVALGGASWRAVALVESLFVDGDVDLFDQLGALAPVGAPPRGAARANAVVAALAVPVCAVGRGLVPPAGRERNTVRRVCGGVLALACLFALVLGWAQVARALVREGHGVPCALGAVAVAALGTPAVGDLLREPDLARALAFLGAAVLMAWRSCPDVPDGARVVLAVALLSIQPVAAGWLLLVVWDLSRSPAPPDDEEQSESTVAVLVTFALLVAPQALFAWMQHEPPLPATLPAPAAGSLAGVLICPLHPAVALGVLGLFLELSRRGRAPSLLVPVLVAVLLSTALGEPAGPGPFHPASLAPALAAGLAELFARASGRGWTFAAVLLALLVGAAGVAVELAARLGVPVTSAPSALAWAWQERALIPHLAVAAASNFALPVTLVLERGGAWWGALALAAGAALAAVAVRRVRPGLVLGAIAICGATLAGALHQAQMAGRPRHEPVFAGPRARLDPASPAHSWYPPQGTLCSVVDLAYTTELSPSVGTGDLLFTVLVRDEAGREHAFPVRAEGAWRVERRFRCALPWRSRVAEVRVGREHPVARIAVRGVWLGDALRPAAAAEGAPSS